MRAPSIKPHTYLMTLDLFQDLDKAVLERIGQGTTKVHLDKGDMLFRRGDPCQGFHNVIYGQVKLSVIAPNGTEKVLDVVRAGQSFGKATMFTDLAHPMCAQALADTMLLHVSTEAISAEIDRTPRLARRMLAGLSQRVIGLLSDVESYSLRSGIQRLVGYLLCHREAEKDGNGEDRREHVLLDIRKNHLASLLNLTPEHLSRMLSELAKDGLITVEGADIHIHDPQRLAAIVER